LEQAFRDEWSLVVASLARRLRDLDLAEEATADAFAAATTRWPADGVPERPGAWLMTTAWRRALDLRRRADARDRLRVGAGAELWREDLVRRSTEANTVGAELVDDRLGLIFACCHPSLSMEARVALTLRCVVGLPTDQVARSFLVEERTMAQRLLRAKQKITAAGIALEVPGRQQWADRLGSVATVVYLVLTQGGADVSGDLTAEAVWLARLLHRLVPGDAELTALLALAVLQHSRSAARWTDEGRPVPLDEQDRGRWNRTLVQEGLTLVDEALRTGPPGRYQVEAAIAAVHSRAPSVAATDWPQVAQLYAVLSRLAPSPVVEVNRAVAVGMADGPIAGLAVLDAVSDIPLIARYAPAHAARARLLELAGHQAAAAASWSRAAEFADPTAAAELRRRHLGS
jgi:RNA polymerase sigma-70 factor (ECF subfamily)